MSEVGLALAVVVSREAGHQGFLAVDGQTARNGAVEGRLPVLA